MTLSAAHRFGQIIGDLIEEIMLPWLQSFCDKRGLYLDKEGARTTREGNSPTWIDKHANNHYLDFVIEKKWQ